MRISIDLGKKEEESETWLQVGRIYYLVYEDELADMYLQVRSVGVCTVVEGTFSFQCLLLFHKSGIPGMSIFHIPEQQTVPLLSS